MHAEEKINDMYTKYLYGVCNMLTQEKQLGHIIICNIHIMTELSMEIGRGHEYLRP